MTNKKFYGLMQSTFESAMKIAESKGADYTKGSADALEEERLTEECKPGIKEEPM